MLSDVSNGCKILNSRTALWHAAKAGHLEVVRYLLHEGAAINPRRDYAETNNSGTPLYVSIDNGHFPIVMYLIEQGLNDIVTKDLHCGASTQLQSLVMLLFEVTYYQLGVTKPEVSGQQLLEHVKNAYKISRLSGCPTVYF